MLKSDSLEATITPDENGYYAFAKDLPEAAMQTLAQMGGIEKLKVTGIPVFTVRLAKRLAPLRIEQLWIWCDVTRRAMRYLIQTPGLRIVDLLCINGPGQLANFGKAQQLEVFRANHFMTERDLLEVTRCASLREIGAQNAALSESVIAAFLALPGLTGLDLAGSNFDDRMARQISASTTIAALDLGATRLTRRGLEHLTGMRQLHSLDLWAADLEEDDFKLLLNLPNLEYLSLGGYDHLPSMDADKITSLLLEMPSLKRVWLDGVCIRPDQQAALEARLESLRLTCVTP